jgi:hypothetical protein
MLLSAHPTPNPIARPPASIQRLVRSGLSCILSSASIEPLKALLEVSVPRTLTKPRETMAYHSKPSLIACTTACSRAGF